MTPYVGGLAQTPISGISGTSTTVSGLTKGVTYTFKVAAVTGIPVGLAIPSLYWLEFLCYHLARAWKTLFAYQFLTVAKRKS